MHPTAFGSRLRRGSGQLYRATIAAKRDRNRRQSRGMNPHCIPSQEFYGRVELRAEKDPIHGRHPICLLKFCQRRVSGTLRIGESMVLCARLRAVVCRRPVGHTSLQDVFTNCHFHHAPARKYRLECQKYTSKTPCINISTDLPTDISCLERKDGILPNIRRVASVSKKLINTSSILSS